MSDEAREALQDLYDACATLQAWQRLGSDRVADAAEEIYRLETQTEFETLRRRWTPQPVRVPWAVIQYRMGWGGYRDPAWDGLD